MKTKNRTNKTKVFKSNLISQTKTINNTSYSLRRICLQQVENTIYSFGIYPCSPMKHGFSYENHKLIIPILSQRNLLNSNKVDEDSTQNIYKILYIVIFSFWKSSIPFFPTQQFLKFMKNQHSLESHKRKFLISLSSPIFKTFLMIITWLIECFKKI